jgi:hypothetical protein
MGETVTDPAAALPGPLADKARVRFHDEVKLTVQGTNLTAGATARLDIKVRAPAKLPPDAIDSFTPEDKGKGIEPVKFAPLELAVQATGGTYPPTGELAVRANCDPVALQKRDPATYVPEYEPPAKAMEPDDDIQKIAAEQFTFCADTLVKHHRVFYWWSDHAHHHAVDTARKMRDWVDYFLAPHVPGGVDKTSPGWQHVYGRLAPWAGYLHDIGMGANDRMRAELDWLERHDCEALLCRVPDDVFRQAPRNDATLSGELRKRMAVVPCDVGRYALDAVGTFAKFGVSFEPLAHLLALHRELGKDTADITTLGLKAIVKEIFSNTGDGIRKRHSLNSMLYCTAKDGSGAAPQAAKRLREKFSAQLMEKIGLTLCMHSKSSYGAERIDADVLGLGCQHHRENSEKLKGVLKEGTVDVKPPGHLPLGPWLAEDIELTFEADLPEADGSPQTSPTLVTSERAYLTVLAKCIGVVDNMRDRGNTGEFRDNQGVSFFRLPLDTHEASLLDGPAWPTRVKSGSFRAVGEYDQFKPSETNRRTFLDVVRHVNAHHPKLKGLFGDIPASCDRFLTAVHPDTFAAVTFHPDNDVLVPPGNWRFNLGELSIVKSELTSAAKLDGLTSLGIPGDAVVDRIVIDSDFDPPDVAHIVSDIIGEGPRGFDRDWVIAFEVAGSRTPLTRWLHQDYQAPAWRYDPKARPPRLLPGVTWEELRGATTAQMAGLAEWWGVWGPYTPKANARAPFIELTERLMKYLAPPFNAALVMREQGGWRRVRRAEVANAHERAKRLGA